MLKSNLKDLTFIIKLKFYESKNVKKESHTEHKFATTNNNGLKTDYISTKTEVYDHEISLICSNQCRSSDRKAVI